MTYKLDEQISIIPKDAYQIAVVNYQKLPGSTLTFDKRLWLINSHVLIMLLLFVFITEAQ